MPLCAARSGVERMRRVTSCVDWDASSLGSAGSMESVGTQAMQRLKDEQAKVAAADVLELHQWEVCCGRCCMFLLVPVVHKCKWNGHAPLVLVQEAQVVMVCPLVHA